VKGKRVEVQVVVWAEGFGVSGFVFHHEFESRPVSPSSASWLRCLSNRERMNHLMPRSMSHPRMDASTRARAICNRVLSNHPAVKYPMAIEYAAQMAAEMKSSIMNFSS